MLEEDIHVGEEDTEEDLIQLLKRVKPTWERITIKRLYGGFLNNIFRIHNEHIEDVWVCKVFNKISQTMIQHELEYTLLKQLHNHGACMPLYCKFKNGYLYKYAEGESLTANDLKSTDIMKQIFQGLHSIHNVPIPPSLLHDAHLTLDANVYIMNLAYNRINEAPHLDKDEKMLAVGLKRETVLGQCQDAMERYCQLQQQFPQVICHMDPKYDNILYNAATGDVTLIDFDLLCVGPELMDMAVLASRDFSGALQASNMLASTNPKLLDEWVLLYLETHPTHKECPDKTPLVKKWREGLQIANYYITVMNCVCFVSNYLFYPDSTYDYLGPAARIYQEAEEKRHKLQ